MWQLLLDALFPRISLDGQPGVWTTSEEWSALLRQARPFRMQRSALHAQGIRHMDHLVVGGDYDRTPLLRTAICTFKYRRIRALAAPLGAVLVQAAPLLVAPIDTVVCPVPLHRWRLCMRGFNQSLLLAQQVARARGWRVEELLIRVRRTGHQAHRHRAARLRAMERAFCVASTVRTVPSHVVLIDDVCTTGATLDACAAALRAFGVSHVSALVVARG